MSSSRNNISELRSVCLKGICVGELQREIFFSWSYGKVGHAGRVYNPALVSKTVVCGHRPI